MQRLFKIFLILWLYPIYSSAHGPTPQKASERIVINAPVDKVWEIAKNFDALSNWHPEVKQSTGNGKNTTEGIRTLTLHNGESIVESLDFYSDNEHEYSYRLKTENVKALPVSSYTATLQVIVGEMPNTSVVIIKSRFYRGDTSNTPPEHLNDAAAIKAMNVFFQHGLQGLKQKLEQ